MVQNRFRHYFAVVFFFCTLCLLPLLRQRPNDPHYYPVSKIARPSLKRSLQVTHISCRGESLVLVIFQFFARLSTLNHE